MTRELSNLKNTENTVVTVLEESTMLITPTAGSDISTNILIQTTGNSYMITAADPNGDPIADSKLTLTDILNDETQIGTTFSKFIISADDYEWITQELAPITTYDSNEIIGIFYEILSEIKHIYYYNSTETSWDNRACSFEDLIEIFKRCMAANILPSAIFDLLVNATSEDFQLLLYGGYKTILKFFDMVPDISEESDDDFVD